MGEHNFTAAVLSTLKQSQLSYPILICALNYTDFVLYYLISKYIVFCYYALLVKQFN